MPDLREAVGQGGRLVAFAAYFLREFLVANAQVVREVLAPGRLRPGVAAVPLASRSDLEVTLIANLVTLTPGTLTLAVQREPGVLYVHGMFAEDVEAFREQIREMERRMLRALRRPGRAEGGGAG